jgi:hypothetical protein
VPSSNNTFATSEKKFDGKFKEAKHFDELVDDHRLSLPRGYTLHSRSFLMPNIPNHFDQQPMEDGEPAVDDYIPDLSVYKSLHKVEVLPGVFMEL